MSLLQALILGLVEGVTEYLPVSSTGHLVLARAALGMNDPQTRQALDAFLVVVQGGAILAVLGLYRGRIMQMLAGLAGRDPAGRRLLVNLIIAFLPAAAVGPFLDDIIEARLFHPVPVIAALAAGGVLMIAITPWQRRFFRDDAGDDASDVHEYVDIEHLTWRRALLIGLAQCVAMWPGMSRSMCTIVGGMAGGLRPRHAAEFSFLLALPTLGGASLFRLAKNVAGGEVSMFTAFGWLPLIVGLAVATISAALAVKWLVGYLTRHSLAVFGWYRLVVAAVFGVLVYRGWIGM